MTHAFDPSSPCSSPPHNATRIVRRGRAPIAFRIRIASITVVLPSALSVAPTPVCHESRWPPIMTTSSFSAGSVPDSSAITL